MTTADDVFEVIRGFGPVKITLGKVGVFLAEETGKEYDILYVAVHGERLHELHNLIGDSLPHATVISMATPVQIDFDREYIPHICIAYLQPGIGRNFMGSAELEGTEMEFNHLHFSDRDGHQSILPLTIPSRLSKSFAPSTNGHAKSVMAGITSDLLPPPGIRPRREPADDGAFLAPAPSRPKRSLPFTGKKQIRPRSTGDLTTVYPPPDPKPYPEAKLSPMPGPPAPIPEYNAAAVNSIYWHPPEFEWRLFQQWVGQLPNYYPSLRNLAEDGWARGPRIVATEAMSALKQTPIDASPELKMAVTALVEICEKTSAEVAVFVQPEPGPNPGPPLVTDMKAVPPMTPFRPTHRKGEWDESAHPRADDGKFGSGGGGESTAESDKPSDGKSPQQRSEERAKMIRERKAKEKTRMAKVAAARAERESMSEEDQEYDLAYSAIDNIRNLHNDIVFADRGDDVLANDIKRQIKSADFADLGKKINSLKIIKHNARLILEGQQRITPEQAEVAEHYDFDDLRQSIGALKQIVSSVDLTLEKIAPADASEGQKSIRPDDGKTTFPPIVPETTGTSQDQAAADSPLPETVPPSPSNSEPTPTDRALAHYSDAVNGLSSSPDHDSLLSSVIAATNDAISSLSTDMDDFESTHLDLFNTTHGDIAARSESIPAFQAACREVVKTVASALSDYADAIAAAIQSHQSTQNFDPAAIDTARSAFKKVRLSSKLDLRNHVKDASSALDRESALDADHQAQIQESLSALNSDLYDSPEAAAEDAELHNVELAKLGNPYCVILDDTDNPQYTLGLRKSIPAYRRPVTPLFSAGGITNPPPDLANALSSLSKTMANLPTQLAAIVAGQKKAKRVEIQRNDDGSHNGYVFKEE